jgi:hypothetical protein
MNAGLAALIGGLGGGFLAVIASLSAVQLQSRAARNAELERERRAASSDLLAHSALLTHLAGAMHVTMQIRSGLKEGLDITLRQRKPADPLELHDRLRAEFEPIYRAQATIWTLETQDVIDAANRVSAAAGEVVSSALTRGEGGTRTERFVQGEKWTQDQLNAWQTQIQSLADARRDFNALVRNRLDQRPVEVFAANRPQPD